MAHEFFLLTDNDEYRTIREWLQANLGPVSLFGSSLHIDEFRGPGYAVMSPFNEPPFSVAVDIDDPGKAALFRTIFSHLENRDEIRDA
jgi:hypothetical protein